MMSFQQHTPKFGAFIRSQDLKKCRTHIRARQMHLVIWMMWCSICHEFSQAHIYAFKM